MQNEVVIGDPEKILKNIDGGMKKIAVNLARTLRKRNDLYFKHRTVIEARDPTEDACHAKFKEEAKVKWQWPKEYKDVAKSLDDESTWQSTISRMCGNSFESVMPNSATTLSRTMS